MKATYEAMNTKVCPSCHSTLFADMDVCYGCLYDFNRVSQAPLLVCPEQLDVPHEDAPYEAELQPPLEAYMGSAGDSHKCFEDTCDNSQASEQKDYSQDGPKASLENSLQTTARDSPQSAAQQTTAQDSRQASLQTNRQDSPQNAAAVSPQLQAPCCLQAHDNCKLIEVGDAQVIVIVRTNN